MLKFQLGGHTPLISNFFCCTVKSLKTTQPMSLCLKNDFQFALHYLLLPVRADTEETWRYSHTVVCYSHVETMIQLQLPVISALIQVQSEVMTWCFMQTHLTQTSASLQTTLSLSSYTTKSKFHFKSLHINSRSAELFIDLTSPWWKLLSTVSFFMWVLTHKDPTQRFRPHYVPTVWSHREVHLSHRPVSWEQVRWEQWIYMQIPQRPLRDMIFIFSPYKSEHEICKFGFI